MNTAEKRKSGIEAVHEVADLLQKGSVLTTQDLADIYEKKGLARKTGIDLSVAFRNRWFTKLTGVPVKREWFKTDNHRRYILYRDARLEEADTDIESVKQALRTL